VPKKKIWANFQRIIELFAQKIVTKLSKVWVWDSGSGKKLFRIPDPGVKKTLDPGSGSALLAGRPKNMWIPWIRIRGIETVLGSIPASSDTVKLEAADEAVLNSVPVYKKEKSKNPSFSFFHEPILYLCR
jgi:hypothetical protein